ncbi:MAG: hypothetical protein WEC59_00535 [Salibacteraceae bacterium]
MAKDEAFSDEQLDSDKRFTTMKNLKAPIIITTAVWMLFQLIPFLSASMVLLFTLQLITTLFMIWMVLRILKDGKPSKATFEDRFYEDQY